MMYENVDERDEIMRSINADNRRHAKRLAAAVEEARKEEREEIAKWFERMADNYYDVGDTDGQHLRLVFAEHIRRGDHLKSTTCGEEK